MGLSILQPRSGPIPEHGLHGLRQGRQEVHDAEVRVRRSSTQHIFNDYLPSKS